LSWMELLRGTVVMVIGQHARQHIHDCGIAVMAVEADVPAGPDLRC
jgi:hypothetical protein